MSKSRMLCFRVPVELAQALDDYCVARGMNRTEVIRSGIDHIIDQGIGRSETLTRAILMAIQERPPAPDDPLPKRKPGRPKGGRVERWRRLVNEPNR
jgi:hypothetical protein